MADYADAGDRDFGELGPKRLEAQPKTWRSARRSNTSRLFRRGRATSRRGLMSFEIRRA